MKKVDSQALGTVQKALGLTGSGAPSTEFLDGTVDQVLDVASMVRRGRTLSPSAGIFLATLQNVHGAAETLFSQWEPYQGGTGTRAPFPDPVPDTFDIWLLAAAVRQESGTGTFTGILTIDYPLAALGFGVDDSGAAIAATNAMGLVFWDSVVAQGPTVGLKEDGQPWTRIGMRIPRYVFPATANQVSLVFNSTSSAIATFRCQLLMGLFPVGLGQDAI